MGLGGRGAPKGGARLVRRSDGDGIVGGNRGRLRLEAADFRVGQNRCYHDDPGVGVARGGEAVTIDVVEVGRFAVAGRMLGFGATAGRAAGLNLALATSLRGGGLPVNGRLMAVVAAGVLKDEMARNPEADPKGEKAVCHPDSAAHGGRIGEIGCGCKDA